MKVICKNNSGYYNLTEGKEYQTVSMTPQLITPHFTFPRYITVVDDNGSESTGHAWRFVTVGQCCDDYIKENINDTYDKEY